MTEIERLKSQIQDLELALETATELIDKLGIRGLIQSLESFTVSHKQECDCVHCCRLKRARRSING